MLACETCRDVSRMHAACHAKSVAKGGHGGCIQCEGQLRRYAPPPRPPESETIEVCSDGGGAPDDESTDGRANDGREDQNDGSYAGEGADNEAYDDVAKLAAKRKRKANGKGSGREAKRARTQTPKGGKCAHGRLRSQCKECGGAGICAHGKIRSTCKECGGASICAHGRRRSTCQECGGASICAHGRQRHRCKECGVTKGG